jgi:ubiquinone/menaquinone biosynthesis C-methylase UbiE
MDNAADVATREAYDRVASDYARLLPDMSLEAPLDRAVLAAFVEMLKGAAGGWVAEVGCGSGRVTACLSDAGLDVVGLDLSSGMAAVAASLHPDLSFAVGHAGALPVRRGVLAGLVAWYSLINLPSSVLPQVFSEFARATRPGAPVILAFQSGNGERVDRTSAYGHAVPMTYYRHAIDATADALTAAGFTLHASLRREAALTHETTAQGFLLAHRQNTR